MENKVKGTEYDDRNIHRCCRDYRNNRQYHCYDNRYPTDPQETQTSEK